VPFESLDTNYYFRKHPFLVSIIKTDQTNILRSRGKIKSVPNFITLDNFPQHQHQHQHHHHRQHTHTHQHSPNRNSAAIPLAAPSSETYNHNSASSVTNGYDYYNSYVQDPNYSADKHKNKQYPFMNMLSNESSAYAHHRSPQSYMSRFQHYCHQHATTATAMLCFFVFLLIFTGEEIIGNKVGVGYHGLRVRAKADPHWGGAAHPGYFNSAHAIAGPTTFKFAAVTDMDELTRIPGSGKPMFQSHLMPGTLTFDTSLNKYSVQFGDLRTLISGHNESGRGMELSELTLYQNRLLAFDDRTGSVFEILSKNKDESYVVPRFVITEGEGDTDKGMKWEWATVKGNELHIGSMGKEYTRPDGSIANVNNLWIATINPEGQITRKDWSREYTFVRHLLGADAPGYVIHEAVLWSEVMKKWIFIPRRVSADKYNDVVDEKKGTNKIVLVDENFTKGQVIDIKMDVDPLHGFSTAAFVPNSNERHITAIRSVEEDCVGGDETLCKQRSYLMVFDALTGDVLMDEVKFDSDIKFEGVEFVDVATLTPV